uniref:Uncharacterized protein n=1 Tax=Cacopsylla melanoneura TaxID=428564 RepID=A0A8D8WR72_9HEMI
MMDTRRSSRRLQNKDSEPNVPVKRKSTSPENNLRNESKVVQESSLLRPPQRPPQVPSYPSARYSSLRILPRREGLPPVSGQRASYEGNVVEGGPSCAAWRKAFQSGQSKGEERQVWIPTNRREEV